MLGECGFVICVLILSHFELVRDLLALSNAVSCKFVTVGSTGRARSGVRWAARIIRVGRVRSRVVVAVQFTLATISGAFLTEVGLLDFAF